MIRIAVCDDEVIFVRCLRDMVEALFEKQGMEFQCFVYTSAPVLIRAHRKAVQRLRRQKTNET